MTILQLEGETEMFSSYQTGQSPMSPVAPWLKTRRGSPQVQKTGLSEAAAQTLH